MLKDDIGGTLYNNKYIAVIVMLFITGYIALYLILGFYAQPTADDYCYANSAIKNGFLQSQISWYTGWSGRYASTAIISLFALYCDLIHVFWFIPLFLIATTCVAFSVLIHTLAKGYLTLVQTVSSGLVLAALYLSGVPSTSETFYWLSGGITYQGGNVLYLLLLATVINLKNSNKDKTKRRNFLIACLLVTLIAGMNETIMFLQSLTLAFAATLAFKKAAQDRFMLLAIMALSLFCAVIVIAAPGNAVRSGFFPLAHHLLFSVTQSAKFAFSDFTSWAKSTPLWLATFICIPSASARVNHHMHTAAPKIIAIFALATSWLLLLSLLYFPALWSMGSPPPSRTLSITYLIFVMGWFPTMALIGSFFPIKEDSFSTTYYKILGMTLILCLFVTGNGAVACKDIGVASGYLQQFDKRYERIKEAKALHNLDIKVPVLQDLPRTIHLSDISVDKKDWKNISYAEYFGVKSIATTWKMVGKISP